MSKDMSAGNKGKKSDKAVIDHLSKFAPTLPEGVAKKAAKKVL